MNIMVFNVPAESVGALSILNEFYDDTKYCKDKSINWFFVLSKPNLKETDNIKVLRFPWLKKSWFHRLYFDNIIAPKLIKKYKIDKVVSFQNVIIPHTNVNQTLYVHNCLPFINYKFTLKEDRLLWIYQNIISKKIIKSIKEADKVIVQTKWMKEACIERTYVKGDKISVMPPKINLDIKHFFEPNKKSLSTFFYPASEFVYKNHELIVNACKKLKDENITDFKVIFTLVGDENDHIIKLYREVKQHQLPIEFVGSLSREKVFDLYTKSILVFPSYIETFGLPLLEARMHRTPILASDCSFSREVLEDYSDVNYFDPFNSNNLEYLLKEKLM
ncbi:glycosyltransferase [Metabacillus sediminilitoris]|uniref:Glycosyltransferase family 4 protein n=1 Tax=Metabacillus sediminilitoris TaxID=2567941 RepID=A0A4S4C153_9BACI|nr:glycosyltransferase [Metabacillus sediminilitoris]QGQ48271.1 glycosyltransferase [Metabacillus sediminilitoris]THF81371.1 glycosyltransferase family 4 protein [Metabacillus sediminilitoris]